MMSLKGRHSSKKIVVAFGSAPYSICADFRIGAYSHLKLVDVSKQHLQIEFTGSD